MKFKLYRYEKDCSIRYDKEFDSPNQETAEFFTLLESRLLEKGQSVRLYKLIPAVPQNGTILIMEISR